MAKLFGLQSSVGKKVIMAVTGLLLFGFVIGHLLGNLLIFAGPDALNAYALKLTKLGALLWVMRFGLLTILLAHVITAIQLTLENRRARPVDYACKKTIQTSYAARTMMMSGLIVLAYIIYHLLHFTLKVTNPEISNLHDALGHHDVYSMVVLSFQKPVIATVYILATGLLCFHLSHGLSSLFQSLGLTNEKKIACMKKASAAFSLLIFLGYASIPASVLFGFVKLAGGAS